MSETRRDVELPDRLESEAVSFRDCRDAAKEIRRLRGLLRSDGEPDATRGTVEHPCGCREWVDGERCFGHMGKPFSETPFSAPSNRATGDAMQGWCPRHGPVSLTPEHDGCCLVCGALATGSGARDALAIVTGLASRGTETGE